MFPQMNLGLSFCTWANSVVLSQQKTRCDIATFGLDAIQHHCPGSDCSEIAACNRQTSEHRDPTLTCDLLARSFLLLHVSSLQFS